MNEGFYAQTLGQIKRTLKVASALRESCFMRRQISIQPYTFFAHFFSHPDYTVGPGFPPDPARKLAGCNRRLGISPYPEECYVVVKKKSRLSL